MTAAMTPKPKKTNLELSHARDTITGGKRSPHWPAVEHAHLKQFPTCHACGSDKHVQVHHMKPFHLHPDLELEPTNLISLCMDNDCHLYVGHGDNFKAYNPDVKEDADKVAADRSNLKTVLNEVKLTAEKKRLFE